MSDTKKVEIKELSYEVIKEGNQYELRQYPDFMVVTVDTSKPVGSQGFNALFNYINGKNVNNKEIPMTAPVINTLDEGHPKLSFVILNQEDIPKPLSQQVEVQKIPGGTFAAFKFSGLNFEGKISKLKKELEKWVYNKGYLPVSEFYLARFNPPTTLPFLRRNEIIVRIKTREKNNG